MIGLVPVGELHGATHRHGAPPRQTDRLQLPKRTAKDLFVDFQAEPPPGARNRRVLQR